MAEAESERFLRELAMEPHSVHKAPKNRYQHFVNAYVVTNKTMKREDAVRSAQVEWKTQVSDSEEKYTAALGKAEEQLKRNKMRRIDSYFKV